ncbi:malonyl-CoA synthase [Castellaniella sp. GW247-6E4]|uniref:malonate--CoA ligase n=1 Tax=Castellaniella sp. GW247-6E4 TaxID=3140380 RepID=UPI003314E6CC
MQSNENLYVVLASGFPEDRGAVALQTPERGYSWDDIDRGSARIANVLRMLACPGARVAVQVHKSPEALMLYLAALRAGLVYLPLNTAYHESEVAYFLGDAEPAVVVCDSGNLEWVERVARQAGTAHVLTLDADAGGTLMAAAAGQGDAFVAVARQAGDLAAILYTSGTTGRSKGAMLTHGNLASNALTLKEYWGWRPDDVLLHMLPIFHIHGLFVATHGALLSGARMVWLPGLNIDQALRYLPECTLMMGVPTYYVRLLGDARFTRELCAGVRLFVSGSAPLLEDTFREFEARIGPRILERYGMSEAGMITSNPCDPALGERIAGTVGPALPGIAVRVVDDADRSVAAGVTGHVQVRGPNVFAGYWRMPEKTQQEFTGDGWFRTGDLGTLGGAGIPDHYLSIVGRSKDLIISGGYNVYPKEIEIILDDMSGVQESAVIGVPHKDFGEAVVAVVVPRQGASIDVPAMLAGLKAELANFKVPKQIHVVDSLPRNTMGKVQKNVLRQRYG